MTLVSAWRKAVRGASTIHGGRKVPWIAGVLLVACNNAPKAPQAAMVEAVDGGSPIVVAGPTLEERATPAESPGPDKCSALAHAAKGDLEEAHVFVDSAGAICFGDRRVVDDTTLERLARAHSALRSSRRVIIYADRATPIVNVQHVMEVLKDGGLDEVSFAVAPP